MKIKHGGIPVSVFFLIRPACKVDFSCCLDFGNRSLVCGMCVCVGDTRWCPARAGAEVSKIGNDYKKSMAYRNVSF